MITDRKIYMCAARINFLEKGLLLQSNHHVVDLKINNADHTIHAKVIDQEEVYYPQILLDNRHNILNHHCTCDNSSKFIGACEHVIAALKQAQIDMDKSQKKSNQLEKTINDILNAFDICQKESQMVKIDLNFEIHLTPIFNQSQTIYLIYFKVGLDKLYIVNNIKDFLNAFLDNSEIKFGKSFTLYPEYHQIPKHFLAFFNILQDMNAENNLKFKSKKELIVDQHYFKKLINSLMYQSIIIHTHDSSKKYFISNDTYQPQIIINDHHDIISIDLTPLKKIIALTHDYQIIIDDSYIYQIDNTLLAQLTPFFNATKIVDQSIEFKGKYREEFITKIIPNLPKYVEIPDSLKSSYIRYPFNANLYLDKDESKILVTPQFCYGNYKFNPLEVHQPIKLDNQILLRQTSKEEELMNVLDNANFKVSPKHFYIDTQQDITSFVFNYLPILQENMNVYYSDDFKKIIKNNRLTTNLRYNDALNLFEYSFFFEDISFQELKDILKNYQLKKKYYQLKDGSILSLNDQTTKNLINTLNYMGFDIDSLHTNTLQLSIADALFLNQEENIVLQDDDYFKKMISEIQERQLPSYIQPDEIHYSMREYQIHGLEWLKTLSHYRLGGILADDMGLGKTLQTIAFLTDSIQKKHTPNLVVCPSSLVYNWEDEIKKFNPHLKYLIIDGTAKQRASLIHKIKQYDVIVTSYPLLKKDILLYQDIQFYHCIIDEAQYIKNHESLSAKAVKSIKAISHFALTGTPIENSLSELWSIFDFVMPGLLLSYSQFKQIYEIPIVKNKDKEAHEKLMKRIHPFMLRRMKQDVLQELPDKIETKYLVELTSKQKELYLALLKETKQKIINEDENQKTMTILSALTRLRQLCNHPSMFIDNYYGTSAKLEVIREIIQDTSKQKILIFSQFTSMLHLIEDQLNLENISYCYLDGQTSTDKRIKLVKDFNNGDQKVFLISLKAGGTGLNLTSASTIIIVDPWWNPAIEQQAIDRAYRIGQKQNIQVIKLIAKGTVEEKIYHLQQQKLDLIHSVVQTNKHHISNLSKEELLQLFDS